MSQTADEPGRTTPAVSRKVRPNTYEMIKHAIVTGEFRPGQQLVETALASWCGVSRTPVREALKRLQQDGLVVPTSQGMAVREHSVEETIDLYDSRIVIEGAVVRVACERRNDHDLRQLDWSLAAEEAAPSDGPAIVNLNQEFHRAVWRASHNESLIDLLERLTLQAARNPGSTLSAPGRWAQAHQQHISLVDAIRRRDADVAAEIVQRHFHDAKEIRLALLERDHRS